MPSVSAKPLVSKSLTSRPLNDAPRSALRWKPGAMLPAIIALLAVQLFRADQHRWLPAMWLDFAVFVLIPVVAFWVLKRWFDRSASASASNLVLIAQGGAVLIGLLTIAWQFVSRRVGLGEPNEIIALLAIQNIGWHLAVFSSLRGFERASLMLCGAFVFFVCCMTERIEILVVSGIFAVLSLWWLAGIYWSRLDAKAIDGDPKMLAIHGTATGIAVGAILLAVGIALVIPISRGEFSVAGFMPFSGGEDGYQDDFATSGVGDGNMLVAGNNATTTGAVDSNEFIEDDKPSMYDVISEKYDGPAFKKPLNRAVALDVKAKHIHDVKQSEQSGRTFRTMRNTDKVSDLELENRLSKALFYVEGSVPARFVLDSFHSFDGWDWNKVDIQGATPMHPKIELQKYRGKPIYKLFRFKPDYLTSKRPHKLKIMRLESKVLPTPSFLDRWHIDRVDKLEFFRWNDASHIEYAGQIPRQTIIDVGGFVPNYHIMRSARDLRDCEQVPWWQNAMDQWLGAASSSGDAIWHSASSPVDVDPDSPFLQLPENGLPGELEELVKQYTRGVQPGWNQVESIVNGLREDFELNPKWEVSETVDNTISHFLDQKGGPSWMFATSCAMALRKAGYRTRLATGFLVRSSDYDRAARQSIVTKDNVHMWPEVCLDGKYWIPLEPTPGYPVPYSVETAWQWLVAKVQSAISWVVSHPVISTVFVAASVLGYLYRANLLSWLMLLWWNLVRILWPAGLLRATRQLIDLRFWAAGDKRPLSRTLEDWYTRVEPDGSADFFELWNAQNYSSHAADFERRDVVARCRQQIDLLPLEKIQKFVSERTISQSS